VSSHWKFTKSPPGAVVSETAKEPASVPSQYGGKSPGQFVAAGRPPATAVVAVRVPAPEREGQATMTARRGALRCPILNG
jgi:hypothetical protein